MDSFVEEYNGFLKELKPYPDHLIQMPMLAILKDKIKTLKSNYNVIQNVDRNNEENRENMPSCSNSVKK